ncbi:hypothetical protein KIN20_022483 [Parelaphostrongylus tenuis]|uniref:Uncharacterized protein n=1 Tax=Parelaphostrongylus tenuis TaxID=148309 RepID=A0AAD5QSA7_PARTN|nr:hypothetical protein KIN20_022483 [Parelaphostrongylus tenuis]
MVFTVMPNIAAKAPGMASNREAAQGFVSPLVMQTIFDIREQQGCSTLLPGAIITAIWNNLGSRSATNHKNARMQLLTMIQQ